MSNIGKKNKHLKQKQHAMRRCRERLGFELTENDYDALIKRIQNNEGKCVKKQSNRVSHFKIDVRGEDVVVVYDKHRKTIVTFLTINPDPIFEEIFGWTKR